MSSRFSIEAVVSMIDKVSGPMNKAGNSVAMFHQKSEKHFGGIGATAKNVLGTLGIVGGLAAVAAGFKKVVTSAMMLEDAEAAFTPILGGTEKAADLVNRLNILGAKTPFQFKDLAGVAKQLLPVMNGDLGKTIDTISMLGDTAGGNAQKLETITRGYTKAMLKGKVDMESLNMIGEAGVPIVTELAKSMGYGKDQMGKFFKVISGGGVKTEDLTKVFQKMTSQGGMFYQGMIIASKTTSGVFSTLEDNITMTSAGIGKELLPTIKDIALGISDIAAGVLEWVTNNKPLIQGFVSTIKTLLKIIWSLRYVVMFAATAWLAYHAALKVVMALQLAKSALQWVQYLNMMWPVILKATASTNAWGVAQWLLNAAMSANPLALIIIGITALIAAGVALYKNWDVVKQFFISMWGTITGAFSSAIDWIVQKFTAITDWISAKWNAIKSFLGFGDGGTVNLNANVNQSGNGSQVSGYASPNSGAIANGNGSTSGKVDINVNSPKGAANITQSGKLPANTNLNLGYQN